MSIVSDECRADESPPISLGEFHALLPVIPSSPIKVNKSMVRLMELPFVEPLEAYRRLPIDRFGSAILHSGLDPLPEHHYPLARFCFFAFEPFAQLSCNVDEGVFLIFGDRKRTLRSQPFIALRELWETLRAGLNQLPDLPTPFSCGLIGYLGYDLRVTLERLPLNAHRDIPMPDMWFGAYGATLTWDLYERKLYAITTGLPETGKCADRVAALRLEQLIRWLENEPKHKPADDGATKQVPLVADMAQSEYHSAIERIKAYIAAGDVYQVNFAHRFRAPVHSNAPSLFLRLCNVHPAPFMALINLGNLHIICDSPERFLQFDSKTRVAHTRPIKGTRKRGTTPLEDERMAKELIESEKDRAEHIMIVDLERNDLGRVAEIGSVRVSHLYALEPHPTIWHLVSTVEARIPQGKDAVDLLLSMFPGGSITGAPKIRAMEIIDEVEPVARGIYTGSIGYWSLNGNCDFNIVIRTAVIWNGWAYFHVGGGIVADSNPDSEYEETLAKAQGLLRMLGCQVKSVTLAGVC
ncbi:MAG: aminodeoxychorismate synthase component I [Armatimonadota bacterium]|nr:aminodeoxychorismate synthase component I [Armatimonadota bacterium]MDW8026423.1 aminodeoxychorismate synthase component I [Armatimonadota bacterium]